MFNASIAMFNRRCVTLKVSCNIQSQSMTFNMSSRVTAAGLAALWCLRAGVALAQTPSLVELAQKEQERRKALKGTAAQGLLGQGSAEDVASPLRCHRWLRRRRLQFQTRSRPNSET